MTHENSLEDFIFRCVGGLSVAVCISSMGPQIHKMWKTKRTNDLSMMSYYINFVGVTLIEVYAFYFNLWEIFIPNVLSWILIVLQITMKKCYDTKYGVLDVKFDVDEPFVKEVETKDEDGNISISQISSNMDLESNAYDEYKVFPRERL